MYPGGKGTREQGIRRDVKDRGEREGGKGKDESGWREWKRKDGREKGREEEEGMDAGCKVWSR